MSKLYRCYDENLKNFLLFRGLRYELKAKDIVTGAKMWVFIKNNTLTELINEWEANSPTR